MIEPEHLNFMGMVLLVKPLVLHPHSGWFFVSHASRAQLAKAVIKNRPVTDGCLLKIRDDHRGGDDHDAQGYDSNDHAADDHAPRCM